MRTLSALVPALPSEGAQTNLVAIFVLAFLLGVASVFAVYLWVHGALLRREERLINASDRRLSVASGLEGCCHLIRAAFEGGDV